MFGRDGGWWWVFGKGFLGGFWEWFLRVVVESGLGVRGVGVEGLVVEGTGVLVEGGGAGDLGFGDCGGGFGGCAAHFLGEGRGGVVVFGLDWGMMMGEFWKGWSGIWVGRFVRR